MMKFKPGDKVLVHGEGEEIFTIATPGTGKQKDKDRYWLINSRGHSHGYEYEHRLLRAKSAVVKQSLLERQIEAAARKVFAEDNPTAQTGREIWKAGFREGMKVGRNMRKKK
jgi:hypothetical protein